MSTVIKTLISTALILALVIAATIYSGVYNIAADEPHWPPTRWILGTAMARSVAVRAGDINVPDNLDSTDRIEAGAGVYTSVCAGCHLGPGVEATPMHLGMLPQPPRLAEHVSKHSSANVFWILKHGIKMSGMPALGESFDDEDLWNVVAFVNTFPDMKPADYQRMTAANKSQ